MPPRARGTRTGRGSWWMFIQTAALSTCAMASHAHGIESHAHWRDSCSPMKCVVSKSTCGPRATNSRQGTAYAWKSPAAIFRGSTGIQTPAISLQQTPSWWSHVRPCTTTRNILRMLCCRLFRSKSILATTLAGRLSDGRLSEETLVTDTDAFSRTSGGFGPTLWTSDHMRRFAPPSQRRHR